MDVLALLVQRSVPEQRKNNVPVTYFEQLGSIANEACLIQVKVLLDEFPCEFESPADGDDTSLALPSMTARKRSQAQFAQKPRRIHSNSGWNLQLSKTLNTQSHICDSCSRLAFIKA